MIDNQAPVLGNAVIGSIHGTSAVLDLAALAYDPDGDPLALTIGTPAQGSLTANSDGTYTYTANSGASGADSFSISVSDGYGGTALATVTIQLDNRAPVAELDVVSPHGSSAIIAVLDNDFDLDGDALTTASAGSAAKGSVSVNGDGTITYVPNTGATGTDTFTYTVSDGYGGAATGTVIVHLDNRAPVARDDASRRSSHGASVSIFVLDNDSDDNGDPLTITANSSPTKGTVALNSWGDGFDYTPNTGATGSDSFTYTISDGHGGTATATVTIELDNNAPAAQEDVFGSSHGASALLDVLANDYDLDWDDLAISAFTNPSKGTLTLNGDDTFTYLPNTGATGIDTFAYTISDGHGGSATATATIHLDNSAPTAADDVVGSSHGANAIVDVLANDYDADGDALTVTIVTGPSKGSLSSNTDGTFTYTPGSGQTGTDTFTYSVSDGHGGSSSANVLINLDNQSPYALDDVVTEVTWTTRLYPMFSAYDPDGDALTLTGNSTPSKGWLVPLGDGSFMYSPFDTATGWDSFTYSISDGHGGTATGTIYIGIGDAHRPELLNVTVNGNYAPLSQVTRYGTTVTFTTAGVHGFTAGNSVIIGGYDGNNAGLNGTFTIGTVAAANMFTVTNTASGLPTYMAYNNQGYQGYALSTTTSNALLGIQRSMVDSIAYTFDQPVDLASNAFTLGTLAPTASGPATAATSAPGYQLTSLDGGRIWVMTWTTAIGHSIADGVYTIDLASSAVSLAGVGVTMTTVRPTDVFYRLAGDATGFANGSARVNDDDVALLSSTWLKTTNMANYNVALDLDGDGRVNSSDFNIFYQPHYLSVWSNFTTTI